MNIGSYSILLDVEKSVAGLDEMRDVISIDEPAEGLLATIIGSTHSCGFRFRGPARRASMVQGRRAAPVWRLLDGRRSGEQLA